MDTLRRARVVLYTALICGLPALADDKISVTEPPQYQQYGHRGGAWQMYGSAALRSPPATNTQRQSSRGGTHQPEPQPPQHVWNKDKFRQQLEMPPGLQPSGPLHPWIPGTEYHGRVRGPFDHEMELDPRVMIPVYKPMEHEGDPRLPCGGLCRGMEFLCDTSCTCIPQSWRCDGEADCVGDADEVGCSEMETECLDEKGNVRCPRNSKCIRKDWLCDGQDDCGDFSDETHCNNSKGSLNCSITQFECANGLCINSSWTCDGEDDCKDYSDEMNCTRRSDCSEMEFRCLDGSCITLAWRCDSELDCSDGSDEEDCGIGDVPECSDGEFRCAYPRCVKMEFRCDGDDDCGDWSDEDACATVADSLATCARHEFRCNSGKCIEMSWRCDTEQDCDDGSDEKECDKRPERTCTPDEYVCAGGGCILKSWVCDGVQDCAEGEDEASCDIACDPELQFTCPVNDSAAALGARFDGVNQTIHEEVSDSTTLLPSHAGRATTPCIARKRVCDGKADCPHGEDEVRCPTRVPCKPGWGCEQACVLYLDGEHGCTCQPGYTISSDGVSCKDIDECGYAEPVCSQSCQNSHGSFVCSCDKGYVLRPDQRTCKALGSPPTLIFANRIDIRQLSLNNLKYTAILKNLHNAISLDYHYRRSLVFWSDISMDYIRVARLNGTDAQDVIRWGLESPSGVAVDWVHDLLFWTDSGTRRVEVATLDGARRHVLASSDLDKPRAIAVHPQHALVFWTDWGPNPKVERIEMDGSNRQSIVTESVFWPNGLTVDYTADRVYWADAKHHVIESAKLDGSDRRKVVTKGLPHPFALTLFEDSIYWTDWHTKSISTASKSSGSSFRTIHSGLHFPMDIHTYHPQRQPNFTNHCGTDNGGCSHLCLPNKDNFKCACPLGLKLANNKRTCDSTPDQLLLFARKKDLRLRRMDAESGDRSYDTVLPVDGVKSAVALAWDSNTDSVFWSDTETHLISRAFLNGSRQRAVISNNLEIPTGLAVDWVTDKLYWTDAGTRRIEVATLDGRLRSLLVWDGLDKPRDISVDPAGGYMFWTDWGDQAKIERAGMDGSGRIVLVSVNLTYPNGLAIDHERGRLYWTDGGTKRIEHVTLDGKHRTTLINTDLLLPFGLALFKDKIYWTDKMSANIYSANKDTGKQRTIVRAGVSNLMDVRVFHRHRQPQPSMCHANNGGCSHLCLLAPQPLGYACACPTGVKLLTDGRQCASGPTNSLVFAHREDIRQISLDVPYTVDIVLPLPRLKSARAVDSDLKTGEIYWTDTELDVIQKAALDGSNMRVVVADGLIGADGIAIDSTGRKLYWTDGERRSIEVAELNGTHRKALFWSGFEGVKPRALALHYHLALLYWSDWGDTGRIERAGMDGSDRQIFISQNIHWPNGLAIDRPAGRLYWTDAKLKRMESVRLDRGDRRVVLNELPHPYGLVLVGSHVYWTDWETEALHRADKINGSERTVIRARLRGLMDIRSIQRDNVAENVCGSDNGGCSHLCLRSPTPVGYSCACPTGVRIDSDGTTCPTQPSSYLLLVTAESLARLSFDTEARLDVSLPVDGIGDAYAIDYHHNKSLIFYSDIDQHIIRAVDMLNMSSTMNVVTTNLSSPFGLAVDWMASNLYWTDYDRRVVEVARLDGSCRKTLVQTDHYQPRSIAVYPRRGFLFWANIGEEPRIERSLLDGSQQFGIITDNLGFPQGLVVDLEERRLFWVDATKDRIEYSNLYGKERKELMPLQSHPFGLTLHGDHIYWTSLFKKTVERAEKMLGRKRTTFHTALHNVMELRFVAADTQTGINPCSVQNGHCSHLCFYTGNLGYRCACPDRPDDIPCSTEPSERIKLSDDQLGDVEDDIEPWDMAPQPPALESSSVLFVLAVTSLCVIAAIVAFFFFAFLYHKRRRRSKKFVYGGVVGGGRGRSVLTFTNPNYSSATASAEHVHPPPEKRPFWAFLKYDRSQERVFDVHSETDSGRQGGGEVEAEAETEVESLTRCAVEFHAGPPG